VIGFLSPLYALLTAWSYARGSPGLRSFRSRATNRCSSCSATKTAETQSDPCSRSVCEQKAGLLYFIDHRSVGFHRPRISPLQCILTLHSSHPRSQIRRRFYIPHIPQLAHNRSSRNPRCSPRWPSRPTTKFWSPRNTGCFYNPHWRVSLCFNHGVDIRGPARMELRF
jgi:hypothetical protein